jgi:hypothetical protein
MKYIKIYEDYTRSQYDAVLIGGLDYRAGDYKIDQQVDLLKKTYGSTKNVKGFRYNTPTSTILEFLIQNPKIDVYMFSAGCAKAAEISKSSNVNPARVFIIEPYSASARTKEIVATAVTNGVPAQNVYVGPNIARGKGTVTGESSSNSASHWGALKMYKASGFGQGSLVKPNSNRVVVEGEYSPRPGDYDGMHSFQSRKKDGFGGKMNTKVNEALLAFYKSGRNPEIKSIDIMMDDSTWKVTWKVVIEESRDGKAWMGINSRGGAGPKDGPSGSIARAKRQIDEIKTSIKSGLADPALEIKEVKDYGWQGKGAYIRQIFVAFTNPKNFPPAGKSNPLA